MLSFFSLPFVLVSTTLAATTVYSRDDSTNPSGNATVDMVSAAWFTSWHAENFTLANVSWDKYTHVTFSFATTLPDPTKVDLGGEDDLLTNFVKTAQQNDVKALVSIGGWTGSQYYSSNVATAENRTAFVKTLVNLKTVYGVDGIDFDWEYPGTQGIGCNVISANDTSNFLAFLQELRADPIGKDLFLTAATSINPWKGPDGDPLADVSGFAEVLDYIAIMNYDVWGQWSTAVGPNAPLNDTCASSANQQGSAVSAVAAWTAAKMPAHQIVLGVASYGHSFTVAVEDAIDCDDDSELLAAYPYFDKTSHPAGDAWDDAAGVDQCGNPITQGGNIDFWGLIDAGYLNANGTVAPGIDYRFDECSQTAYVYNDQTQIMVSFDDAPSFAAKGTFIKNEGLRGFAMWEAGGDSNDILLDSIRQAAGWESDDDNGDDC